MSFRAYQAAVIVALPNADFHEIDEQYRAGVTLKRCIINIRRQRANAKLARRRPNDFEGSDFDYLMNG